MLRSMNTKADLILKLLGIDQYHPSNTEDSANSIGDFTVSPSEEIKSVPTDVDEEDEFELIPSYFFEEDDDSLNFDLLIPSFLFDEEENSSYQVKFQSKEVISSTVNCEKLGCLKELVFSHSKLIGKSCFSLLLDASRSIFPISFNSNEKLIIPWSLILGYQLDFSSIHLTVRSCINDAAILDGSNMFDIMSESVNLSVVGENFFWQLKMATVFDRGKAFQLLKRLFSFHCESEDNLDAITSCVIVILGYYFDLLLAYSTVTLFVQNGDSSDDRQMFHRRPQLSNIPWTNLFFQVPRQSSISMTYYNGKFVNMLNCMHEFESDTSFCASLILVWFTTGGYSVHSRLVTKFSSRNTWSAQVLGRQGGEFFFFQLPCDLLEVLAVYFLCLMCVVTSQGARVPVSNSSGTHKISCILLRNSIGGPDAILLPSTAVVFHELFMLIVARRGAVVLLGERLGVISVEHRNTLILPIFFQKFHYLSILVLSVPTSVFQILNMLLWLAYLRWKFKLFSTVLWYVESISWTYNFQVVEQLMEHVWRPTKLQHNLKWHLHALPAQQCNLATITVNDHALTEVHVRLVPIIQKLLAELIKEFVDSQRDVSKSYFGRRNKVYQAALATGLDLFWENSIMCGWEVDILIASTPRPVHTDNSGVTFGGIGCRLVFDRGKVQLTEKSPDLTVSLHVVLITDCLWAIFILLAVHCANPFYCVLMSIHGDSQNLTRSTPSSLVTGIYVFTFLTVLKTVVTRYVEFLKQLTVTAQLEVKGYIHSQHLRGRAIVENFLTSLYLKPTVPELGQLPSGGRQHCPSSAWSSCDLQLS